MFMNLFAELDAIAVAMPVEKGTFVFRAGDPASIVSVVHSGKIALIWADSREVYPLEAVGAGGIIGLPAVLNGTYNATARAVEDSVLGFIHASRVMEMLDHMRRGDEAAGAGRGENERF